MQATGRKRRRNLSTQEPAQVKTEKGRRTRALILQGVSRAIARHGYGAMTISHIAEEADAPVGLIYRYFRGKLDATMEVLKGLLEEFRETVPAPGPDTTFWQRELALHESYVRLFGEGKTALLGCYFSDTFGESAFTTFFSDETRRFVREHLIALRLAIPKSSVTDAALRPVVLAMVSMTDNFIYRYYTGREKIAGVEQVPIGWLLAALRHRGLLLIDPPRNHPIDLTRLRFVERPGRQPARLPPAPPPVNRLSPDLDGKRADAQMTLVRIKEATLRLLDRFSYDDLRISDIEVESGLTRGGVYYHFRDKRELIVAVLSERLDAVSAELRRTFDSPNRKASAFDDLKSIATVLAGNFARAPGIIRVLYNLEDRDAEVAGHYAMHRAERAQRVSDVLARHMNLNETDSPLVGLLGRVFLAMADRFFYETFDMRPAELSAFTKPEDAAHLLAALWYRMAFLANPPADALATLPALKALKAKQRTSH